jgi:hypothetical protein
MLVGEKHVFKVETWFWKVFLGGFVIGFGMFCFEKILRFGQTRFS